VPRMLAPHAGATAATTAATARQRLADLGIQESLTQPRRLELGQEIP
jgi:hypothetical protein